MDIRFEQSTISGLAVSGVLAILLAITFFIVWKLKTKAKIFPIVVGAATFVLFAEILKAIPLYPLMMTDNAVSRAINNSPVLYYLVAALAAGIFEETGRYLAFKYVLKKYPERRTSLDYAVGHGGIEAVITSISMLSAASLGVMVNSGMMQQLMENYPESQRATVLTQITAYAEKSFGECMLWIPERISAVLMHIGFSILIFCAVRERKLWIYPLTVILHAAVDFCCIFYSEYPIATEIFFLITGVILMTVAVRVVYQRMLETAEMTPLPEGVTA